MILKKITEHIRQLNMSRKSRRKRRQARRQLELSMRVDEVTTKPSISYPAKQYPVTTYRACHRGPKEVMSIGKVRVWAGAHREVRGDYDWDIILRLSDGEYDLVKETQMFNARAREIFSDALNLNKHNPAIIDMRWPDFSEPENVNPEWWIRFNQELKALPPSIMLIHCMGGHGRTGTALSIFAALNGYHKTHPSNDPVQFIRHAYCEDAVESRSQLQYITEVTSVKTWAQTGRTWQGWEMGWGGSMEDHHVPSHSGGYPTSTTQGYVHHLKEGAPYGSGVDPNEPAPGTAYTIKRSQLKGEIEASWNDNGKDYIFADDRVYQVVPGEGNDHLLLEIDWSTGSYSGVSEHRVRTGGI